MDAGLERGRRTRSRRSLESRIAASDGQCARSSASDLPVTVMAYVSTWYLVSPVAGWTERVGGSGGDLDVLYQGSLAKMRQRMGCEVDVG